MAGLIAVLALSVGPLPLTAAHAANEFEPNDTPAQAAGPLVAGQELAATTEHPEDVDHYAIDVLREGDIAVDVTTLDPDGRVAGAVLSPTGAELARFESRSGAPGTVQVAAHVAPGRHLLRVQPACCEQLGFYRVRLQSSEAFLAPASAPPRQDPAPGPPQTGLPSEIQLPAAHTTSVAPKRLELRFRLRRGRLRVALRCFGDQGPPTSVRLAIYDRGRRTRVLRGLRCPPGITWRRVSAKAPAGAGAGDALRWRADLRVAGRWHRYTGRGRFR